MVAVQILQASCCSFSYQASLSPEQRRTVVLKRRRNIQLNCLCESSSTRVQSGAAWMVLTKQASRSSREPLVMKVYTKHGCCPSQENPTISTKFSCFNLWVQTVSSNQTCTFQIYMNHDANLMFTGLREIAAHMRLIPLSCLHATYESTD